MTFTKTSPTEPGFYAWRGKESWTPIACIVSWRPEMGLFVATRSDGYFGSVESCGGEWCRLVPEDELKLAWHEGRRLPAGRDWELWGQSRAKRISEGKQ